MSSSINDTVVDPASAPLYKSSPINIQNLGHVKNHSHLYSKTLFFKVKTKRASITPISVPPPLFPKGESRVAE